MEAELIDTLWNVNIPSLYSAIREQRELIDTLWNVNTANYICCASLTRINRYIMECKFL